MEQHRVPPFCLVISPIFAGVPVMDVNRAWESLYDAGVTFTPKARS
jgi:hypothetical protein